MGAKLEKIENSEAYLNIELEAQKFEEGLQKAYNKVVKEVTIPGFRKGKAPRAVLESHYGKEVLYEDALEFIVPDAFAEAVLELNIEPIARPSYDFNEILEGKSLQFTAKVAIKPEVKLGEIEGLEIEIPRMEVDEEKVNSVLEGMRLRYAQSVEKIDEAASLGDILDINFTGYVDGEAFDGGTGENYPLELGSNTFIPGFEDQLLGTKAGEDKDVKVTFPEEYHAKELAGKDAVFKVTVNKITGKKLRDLNDEFAQEISEHDTMAELRAEIETELKEKNAQQKENATKEKIVDALIEKCELTVAPVVIFEEQKRLAQEFDQRLKTQGFSLERYLKMTGAAPEAFFEEIKPEAERNIKSHFILEKIIKEKGITPTEEEVNEQLGIIAAQMKLTTEEVCEKMGSSIEDFKINLAFEKALKELISSAKVTEVEPEAE
jgi:trigger factor